MASLDIENYEGGTSPLMHSSSSTRSTANLSQAQHNNNEAPSTSSPAPATPPPPQQQGKSTNLPLLSACYMAALTTGATTYAFSFYSNALKSSLHLSQNQLDTLSSATFCAGIMSWLPGMIVDHRGARYAMVMGSTSNAVNLTMYWMIATERWKLASQGLLMVVLSALGVFIFMGCALVTGSVFKVIMESSGSGSKGKAVGCAKGYVGVGSGVYVCLFAALFGSSGGGGVAGPAARALSFARRMGAVVVASSGSSSGVTILASDVPQNPELLSLNFLPMAAGLSFVAATLPALFLLPKKVSNASSAYQSRRDGTRSVHFRVIYSGLLLLGMWVVGVSLMQLREEEQHKRATGAAGEGTNISDSGSSADLDPSPLNRALLPLDYVGYSIMDDLGDGGDPLFSVDDHHRYTATDSSFSRKLVSYVTERLLRSSSSSSSSSERHWGSVFFILLLWWGPALSLLIIPPRKQEYIDEGMNTTDEGSSSFDYGDDSDSDNQIGNEEEEEIFLQDDIDNLPISKQQLSSFAIKNGERGRGEGDHDSDSDERNYNLSQMLGTVPAWLMAWTTVVLVGGGTVMTNNIGQMTEALGFSDDLTPASLALFSAAQGASRVVTGIASELAMKWDLPRFCGCSVGGGATGGGVPRPAFLVLASLVSAVAHLVLAVCESEQGFVFGVTLSGVAFGMVWPMMVLITGEVFGTRHVGANYMFFDGFSSAVGTLMLSKFVAQEVYDQHIVEESHGDTGGVSSTTADENSFKCFGSGCFRMSHIIVSLLSLTCVVSSVGLIRTTRDVYGRRRNRLE